MTGSKKTVWVTGANGQVGSELQKLSIANGRFNFIFTTREQVPIHDRNAAAEFLSNNPIDICINAAAYTAVDLAEKERELAMEVNGHAPGNLAAACKRNGTRLLHISTDYVFNGEGHEPYKESDATDPVNYYGQTKLAGEQLALKENPDTIIVRTSWVYSSFGKNFLKTMLRLMNEKDSIGVVADQVGCPTYAADLASALLHLCMTEARPGIYHYCNSGVISWFDFATAIRDLAGLKCEVNAIKTTDYPTPAKRPAFSALNTSKIQQETGLMIPHWKVSLQTCINQIR